MTLHHYFEFLKDVSSIVGVPIAAAYAVGSVIIIIITLILQFAQNKLTPQQVAICKIIYLKECITIVGLIIFVLLFQWNIRAKRPEKDMWLCALFFLVICWIIRLLCSIGMRLSNVYNILPHTSTLVALKIFTYIFYIIDLIATIIFIMTGVYIMGAMLMMIVNAALSSKMEIYMFQVPSTTESNSTTSIHTPDDN